MLISSWLPLLDPSEPQPHTSFLLALVQGQGDSRSPQLTTSLEWHGHWLAVHRATWTSRRLQVVTSAKGFAKHVPTIRKDALDLSWYLQYIAGNWPEQSRKTRHENCLEFEPGEPGVADWPSECEFLTILASLAACCKMTCANARHQEKRMRYTEALT